jgi:hypothetical protein
MASSSLRNPRQSETKQVSHSESLGAELSQFTTKMTRIVLRAKELYGFLRFTYQGTESSAHQFEAGKDYGVDEYQIAISDDAPRAPKKTDFIPTFPSAILAEIQKLSGSGAFQFVILEDHGADETFNHWAQDFLEQNKINYKICSYIYYFAHVGILTSNPPGIDAQRAREFLLEKKCIGPDVNLKAAPEYRNNPIDFLKSCLAMQNKFELLDVLPEWKSERTNFVCYSEKFTSSKAQWSQWAIEAGLRDEQRVTGEFLGCLRNLSNPFKARISGVSELAYMDAAAFVDNRIAEYKDEEQQVKFLVELMQTIKSAYEKQLRKATALRDILSGYDNQKINDFLLGKPNAESQTQILRRLRAVIANVLHLCHGRLSLNVGSPELMPFYEDVLVNKLKYYNRGSFQERFLDANLEVEMKKVESDLAKPVEKRKIEAVLNKELGVELAPNFNPVAFINQMEKYLAKLSFKKRNILGSTTEDAPKNIKEILKILQTKDNVGVEPKQLCKDILKVAKGALANKSMNRASEVQAFYTWICLAAARNPEAAVILGRNAESATVSASPSTSSTSSATVGTSVLGIMGSRGGNPAAVMPATVSIAAVASSSATTSLTR